MMLDNTNNHNLRILFWLRNFAILGQILAIYVVDQILKIDLKIDLLAFGILFLILINIATLIRFKTKKIISTNELFIQLLVDVTVLTYEIYLTGGITNPFINLYVIQLIISLIMLKNIHSIFLICITTICYLTLGFYYVEVPHMHHFHVAGLFNLHLQGMFITYVIIVAIIAIFIIKILKNLRESQIKLRKIQEQALIEKNYSKLALLAASAAHQINTPLSTISFAVDNLFLDKDKIENLNILKDESEKIKEIISELLSNFGDKNSNSAKLLGIRDYFSSIKKLWLSNKTDIEFKIEFNLDQPRRIIVSDLLTEALINFYDNSIQAKASYIDNFISIENNNLIIQITDNGDGMPDFIIKNFGTAFSSSKESLGMGIFISKRIIEKFKGSLNLVSSSNQGTILRIIIPLKEISK